MIVGTYLEHFSATCLCLKALHLSFVEDLQRLLPVPPKDQSQPAITASMSAVTFCPLCTSHGCMVEQQLLWPATPTLQAVPQKLHKFIIYISQQDGLDMLPLLLHQQLHHTLSSTFNCLGFQLFKALIH